MGSKLIAALLFLVLVFSAGNAKAAVSSYDSDATVSSSLTSLGVTVSALNFGASAGGSYVLFVLLEADGSFWGTTPGTITYNGAAMTSLGGPITYAASQTAYRSLYYIANPASAHALTIAGGSTGLACGNSSCSWRYEWWTYSNAASASPIGATSVNATNYVTSPANSTPATVSFSFTPLSSTSTILQVLLTQGSTNPGSYAVVNGAGQFPLTPATMGSDSLGFAFGDYSPGTTSAVSISQSFNPNNMSSTGYGWAVEILSGGPTPTPTPTPTYTPTRTPTNTPTGSATPTFSATPTASPTATSTNSFTPTITPTFTPSATPTPTNTATVTPTWSDTPTDTPSDTPTLTPTPTISNTPTNTFSNTPTVTNTSTPTATNTWTNTPTQTEMPSDTPSNTPTDTVSYTPTATPTDIPSDTPTWSDTPTDTPSNTPTNTLSYTPTVTNTSTPTATNTWTNTPTQTNTPTKTATSSNTPTQTPTPTFTPSPSDTPTATPTFSFTYTYSPTLTNTATSTSTNTMTYTNTPSYTPTYTYTFTYTPTNTSTATETPTSAYTATPTPTATNTPTPTNTPTLTQTPTITDTFTITNTPLPTNTPNAELYLDVNYFNPDKGPLGMDVRVDQAGGVKIKVFNIAGEEVKKVMDGYRGVGNYRVQWDGTNNDGVIVGNAVYFVIIEEASGRLIRKVIVLR